MKRWSAPIALALVLCSGCAEVPDPEPAPKADPRRVATLVVVLKNAPADAVVRPDFIYGIGNAEKCMPLDYSRAIGGTRPKQQFQVHAIPVSRSASGAYVIPVYADYFSDRDYYGLGQCNWELLAAGIDLRSGHATYTMPVLPPQPGTMVAYRCPPPITAKHGLGHCLFAPLADEPDAAATDLFKAVLTIVE